MSYVINILLLLLFSWDYCNCNVWKWECTKSNNCIKTRITGESNENVYSLAECQLFCDKYASLWPRPTGQITIEKHLKTINPDQITIISTQPDSESAKLLRKSAERFLNNVRVLIPKKIRNEDGRNLVVSVDIEEPDNIRIELNMDESYTLTVSETAAQVMNAKIVAKTYYGARHGLETLGQLIIYNDIDEKLQMPRNVEIVDKPTYTYRGIVLDTARNYISVDTIKRTLDAMASSKLNSFHWHITDTQSFPFISKSIPELAELGAYSPDKVYTPENIREIVNYARVRGIRVLPEFDAPAHVGEGWQNTDFLVCFNHQPWGEKCVEPPCGQLDPTKPGLYDALEKIYGDMIELFEPDLFHMGGDEVSFNCWNATENIVEWMTNKEQNWGQDESDFIKLWSVFQSKAKSRLEKKAGRKLPIILWTSTLTDEKYIEQYLPKSDYIIQVWSSDANQLLEKGYKVILSQYDSLYLDCGFEGWVSGGNNWCSPYIGWQKVYNTSPKKVANGSEQLSNILGSEAALWTEQVDDTTVDSRLWPRAAALAETLWSDPAEHWRQAENRMLIHRQRLVQQGIRASGMQPEWCRQHQNNCPA